MIMASQNNNTDCCFERKSLICEQIFFENLAILIAMNVITI